MAWNQRSGRRDHRGDPGRPDLPGRARPTGLRPVSGCSPSLTGTLNQQMITATPVRSSKSWRQAAAFGRIRSPFSLSMTEFMPYLGLSHWTHGSWLARLAKDRPGRFDIWPSGVRGQLGTSPHNERPRGLACPSTR